MLNTFKKVLFSIGIVGTLIAGLFLVEPAMSAGNPSNEISVSSITQLRSTPASQYQFAFLTQYNSTSGIGSGHFIYTGSTTCTDDNGVLIQSAVNGSNTGCWNRKTEGKPYDISWFGAVCSGVQVTDGVSTSTTTVTSASAKWGNVKTGWVAVVNGAAASGKQLVTTVSVVNSSSSLTLATTTSTSGTGLTISVYPNDTTAITNTVAAAATALTPWTLPAGQTCGFANPGSNTTLSSYTSLYLNNGNLWLGQTGPTTDNGVTMRFIGSNLSVVGPGTIDGLYQTNQNIYQANATAVFFYTATGVLSNTSILNTVVQNTKGRAVQWLSQGAGGQVSNVTMTNVVTNNCGDFTYQHSGSSGDMEGRSMCTQIENPVGWVHITNLASTGAAQSSILVDNLSIGTYDPNLHVIIDGCTFTNAGYYGIDLEDIAGRFDVTNCTVTNNVAPSGALINGGFIVRNVKTVGMNNIQTYGIDSNAFVLTANSSDGTQYETQYVTLSNMILQGSAGSHAAQLYLSTTGDLAPTKWLVNNVRTDLLGTFTSGQACVATNLEQMYLGLINVNVSHQAGGGYDTTFSQQGAGSTMFYIKATGDLGRVQINSLGANTKATLYDLSGAWMNSTSYPAFTGATASAVYVPTTVANPNNNPACP